MTTHVFNPHGACVSEGRNLAIVFSYARRFSGVSRITVDRLPQNRALVNVFYVNGWRACTGFSDFAHAQEWARARSALSPRVSWFAGCAVEVSAQCNGADQ